VITVAPLPDRWTENASWLLQAIDPQNRLTRMIRMDEAGYRAASFLDDRMLHPGLEVRLCSLDQAMADAELQQREDARWIFHIGHVGSTLVSRLLGELDGVLSLREPRSLRDLIAVGDEEQVLFASNLRRIFSRSFAPNQVALIKATSSVSEQAPMLVPAAGLALFLYATPQNYVAGILAGENSLKELAALYEHRLGRLGRRGIDLRGFDASPAHRAAAAWACEMTSLEAAADAMADRRILWADFDEMIGDMAGWLARCARHFEFTASLERLKELVSGPLMRRYSKALEYDYSPSLRAELLGEAARRHRVDITAAIAALEKAAETVPMLNRALERARRES
jgi:hypothetical protein